MPQDIDLETGGCWWREEQEAQWEGQLGGRVSSGHHRPQERGTHTQIFLDEEHGCQRHCPLAVRPQQVAPPLWNRVSPLQNRSYVGEVRAPLCRSTQGTIAGPPVSYP